MKKSHLFKGIILTSTVILSFVAVNQLPSSNSDTHFQNSPTLVTNTPVKKTTLANVTPQPKETLNKIASKTTTAAPTTTKETTKKIVTPKAPETTEKKVNSTVSEKKVATPVKSQNAASTTKAQATTAKTSTPAKATPVKQPAATQAPVKQTPTPTPTPTKPAAVKKAPAKTAPAKVAVAKSTPPVKKAPAYAPHRLMFNGRSLSYVNGGLNGNAIINANHQAISTFYGSAFSGTDGDFTHFIGHNPGAFRSLLSVGNGQAITVTDGSGKAFTYHVYRIVDLPMKNSGDGFSMPKTSAGQNLVDQLYYHELSGEQIVLQTCVVADASVIRLVYAR